MPAPPPVPVETPQLVRGLSAWDGALLTVGSVVGTAIFLAASDVPRALPHPGLVLLAWALGGLLTLAGALSYGELGAMYPHAGGPYLFLREAYGPLWAFLFGWACFLVIMSGGMAALGVGFGQYLGAFFPLFAPSNQLFALPLGSWTWTVNGSQLAGALAVVVLTLVNVVGLREGTLLQNAMTVAKIGTLAGLLGLGLWKGAAVPVVFTAPAPPGLLTGLGAAMIAVLWSFDGWYGLAYVAGEVRDPARNLARGLVVGTLVTTALYLGANLVYLRTLPLPALMASPRVGEEAVAALLGPLGGRVMAGAVLVSAFGCLSATVLFAARTYLPMAEDGVFFPSLARIHPRFRTPAACLVAQGVWTVVLTLSGRYDQLYTYAVCVMFCFHAATGLAVFVLRRTRPAAERPYRVWGYPVVPAVFVLTSAAFVVSTVRERPLESAIGLGLVALGLPAYAYWRRRSGPPRPA